MTSDNPTARRTRAREESFETLLERWIVGTAERAAARQLDDVGPEAGICRCADQWCVGDWTNERAWEKDERRTRGGSAAAREERPDPIIMLNRHRAVGLTRHLCAAGCAVGDERPANEGDGPAESERDPDASNVLPELPRSHRRPVE
jgi:hypothetical protein